jgi:Type IV secretion-system coupling protein DNA-binding domain
MTILQITATYTHGSRGLAAAYILTLISMAVALIQRRARLRRWLPLPLRAALVCGVALLSWNIGRSFLSPLLRPDALTTAGLGAAFLMLFAYVAGLISFRNVEDMQTLRGARLHDARRSRARHGMLHLAGINVPASDEAKHFKLLGTTGTGKSTAIRGLLRSALARGDRAIIADPDGSYLAHFYDPERGDQILNPFDARSARWSLFGELETPYDIEQLARALIPEQGDTSAREWRSYARALFSAITRQLHDAKETNLALLFRLLTSASTKELRVLVAGTAAEPFLEASNARMFGAIRSVLSAAVATLDHVATQVGAPLSVRSWVREGKGVLFLPYSAGQIAALRSLIATWLRIAIFEAMSQPEGDQRLWYIVDELDALGAIDGLKDALARLRKFGGRCVLGMQSIAQVRACYGDADARTIIENCGTSLILRCSASEAGGTAQFASQLIGDRQIRRVEHARGVSHSGLLSTGATRYQHTRNERIHIEPAVLSAEIEQLADFHGFLKLASRPEWWRVRVRAP